MPAFADALPPEQRWAITDFIASLSSGDGPGYTNLVIAKRVQDPIDLSKGTANFDSARPARIPIVGQIMESGRAFATPTTSVVVQAIYDAQSVAVLVRWHDMSAEKAGTNGPQLSVPREEEELKIAAAPEASAADPFADPTAASAAPPEFSDAVAIQIPSQTPTGARKPYFIFGDADNSVDLWFFDLATSAPAQFTGRGSGDITPSASGTITGVANYDQGEWSVIFSRPLRIESGASFTGGEFMPMAFSVWDGFSRERGNRRGLSLWYSLYVEPENVPSAVGPMIRTAVVILALEIALVWWVRRRQASQRRGEIGSHQPAPSV
jgi:DMSO reductase family type II enzyme heme b subunit